MGTALERQIAGIPTRPLNPATIVSIARPGSPRPQWRDLPGRWFDDLGMLLGKLAKCDRTQ